jgi:hypothetical protein
MDCYHTVWRHEADRLRFERESERHTRNKNNFLFIYFM